MNSELQQLIIESNLDKNCLQKLIIKFYPLIKKYTFKLQYDGAETDLIIRFIEVITSMRNKEYILDNERILLSYIKKSIKNHYIYLSKKNSNIMYHESIEENNQFFSSIESNFSNLEFLDTLSILNKREEYIIILILKGYSIYEISQDLHISRQAVNKTKLKAFSKLKKVYLTNK